MAFGLDEGTGYVYDSLEIVAELYFVLDTALWFNVGYFELGGVEMRRREITKQYLKGKFAVNLLASIPIMIFSRIFGFEAMKTSIFYFFKLLRSLKLTSLVESIQNQTNSPKVYMLAKFGSLMFKLLLQAHWIGCLFYSAGKQAEMEGTGWILN